MVEQLLRMLDNIALNAGYPRYLEDEYVLIDHQIYFDICQIIFPELNIKLIKIQDYRGFDPAKKMQYLINLLSEELKIDLSHISGQAIKDFDLERIHDFLEMLLEYSKIYMERMNPSRKRVSTDPAKQKSEEVLRNPKSARGLMNKRQTEDEKVFPKQTRQKSVQFEREAQWKAKRRPSAKGNRRARSLRETNQNVFHSVLGIVKQEKSRVQSKQKKERRISLQQEDQNQIKHHYKAYLDRYTKDNIAAINRAGILEIMLQKRNAAREKHSNTLALRKDYDNIDTFFQSFAFQLRDQKIAYLRKMKQLIRKKEIEKKIDEQKQERIKQEEMKATLKREMEKEQHQHEVRRAESKEKAKGVDESIAFLQKQIRRQGSEQRQYLKQVKDEQFKQMENHLRQLHEKTLLSLSDGNKLEQTILKLYQRY